MSFAILPFLACAGTLFEPNVGQTDSQAQFLARAKHGVIFFTPNSIVFQGTTTPTIVEFLDTDPQMQKWQGLDPAPETISYFLGRDRSKWIHNLPRYRKAERKQIYPGIDLVVYGNEATGALEYDLVAKPGADLSRIRIHTNQPVQSLADGMLLIGRDIRQRVPEVYQDGRRLARSRFVVVNSRTIVFDPGPGYDRSKPTLIDPVLESVALLGGGGADKVTAIGAGTGEVAGTTASIDFPNAPVATRHGLDVFIRTPLSTVIYGGSGDDIATSHSPSGDAFLVGGYTNSRDFPVSANALQAEYAGGASDGFLISPARPYVTYVGTDGDDRITATVGRLGFTGPAAAIGYTDRPGMVPGASYAGGAHDGFFMSLDPNFAIPEVIRTSLGSSADDRPLAIAFSGTNYWVTGELDGKVFISRLSTAGVVENTALLGGSGRESGTAIAVLPAGRIGVAGTTSSRDLPLQSAYKGGASDAFFAIFDAQMKLVAGSYLGGSDTDEATAIAGNLVHNSVFVGGRTRSRDLAVRDPLQETFGGGESDGFVARFDAISGEMSHATYFGGSGMDEISAMGRGTAVSVVFGGSTDSSDLPGNPGSPRSVDGFLAEMSFAEIRMAARVVTAKGLFVSVPFTLGDSARAAKTSVNVVSSDPEKVSVFEVDSLNRTFTAECLAEQGGADVTLSAPGYLSTVTRVQCVPLALGVSTRRGFPATSKVVLDASAITLYVYLGVIDPDTGMFLIQGARQSIRFQLRNENPIVEPLNERISVTGFGQELRLRPIANGVTRLIFIRQDSGVSIAVTVEIQAFRDVPRDSSGRLLLSKGFRRFLPPSIAAKALPVSNTSVFLLQAGAIVGVGESGSQGVLRIQFDGWKEPVEQIVRIVDAEFDFDGIPGKVTLAPGQVWTAVPQVFAIGEGLSEGDRRLFPLDLGQSSLLRVESSKSEAVRAFVNSEGVAFRGETPGEATVTVRSIVPSLRPRAATTGRFEVQVGGAKIPMPEALDLGDRLQARLSIVLPIADGGSPAQSPAESLRIRVRNPELAMLVSAGKLVPELFFQIFGRSIFIELQGLASQGETTLEVTFPGFPTAVTKVRLHPSGIVFDRKEYAIGLGGVLNPSVAGVALHRETLEPLAQFPLGQFPPEQFPPGQGTPGSLEFESLNPDILSDASPPGLQGLQRGTARIRIKRQPQNFVTPTVNQTATVTVRASAASIYAPRSLSAGVQTGLLLGFASRNPFLRLTISSSDSTKVLLSLNPNVLGSAELSFTYEQSREVWVQALPGSSGTVRLRLTGEGLEPSEMDCFIVPLRARLTIPSFPQNGTPPVPILVSLVSSPDRSPLETPRRFVPGFTPKSMFEVRSSNARVVRVVNPLVILDGVLTGQTMIQAMAGGECELEIIPVENPLRVTPLESAFVTVSSPTVRSESLVGALDTTVPFRPFFLRLNANATPRLLTVASGNPQLVRLGRTPAESVASIQISTDNPLIYVHSFGREGTVAVRISGPDFDEGVITVQLASLHPLLEQPRTWIYRATFDGVLGSLRLAPTIATERPFTLRTGVRIACRVSTSDPSILRILRPDLIFEAGGPTVLSVANAQAVGVGDVTLRIETSHYFAPQPVTVQVRNGTFVRAAATVVAQNQDRPLQYVVAFGVPPEEPITFASLDPSKLLLAAGPKQDGAASVTVPLGRLYLQGIGNAGEVGLRLESPSAETLVYPVDLTTSTPQIGEGSLSRRLADGNFRMPLRLFAPNTTENFGVRKGVTIPLRIESSDPTVLEVITPNVLMSSDPDPIVELRPRKAGTAKITVRSSPPSPLPGEGTESVREFVIQ